MRSQFMDYYGPVFGDCLEKWNYLDDLDVGCWNPTEYVVYEPTPLVVKIVSLCVWAAIVLWFAQQSRRVSDKHDLLR